MDTLADPQTRTDLTRTDLPGTECAVSRTIDVIGGRWKSLILYNLRARPCRFNELRRNIPEVTQRMLTRHLRELETDGILHREVLAQVPPHVTYSLTPKGTTLIPVLEAMARWGAEHPTR